MRASALLCLVLVACGDCDDRPVGRGAPTGRARLDGGRLDEDATEGDAGEAGTADLGLDAGAPDLGFRLDAGAPDQGFRLDAATPDLGFRLDMGFWDSGVLPDTGVAPDTGVPPDSGVLPDTGVHPGFGDIWIELDYTRASSPRSPAMRFSNTPGWGERQWAASNATWPEAWDRFNNMSIVNDPIGTSLEIGSSSQLQLMIGLEELIGYQSAEVVLVGRSRATSSSVRFEVTNPWTGCGAEGTMSNDWSPDTVLLDLAQCYVTGSSGGVQAVRVDPTSGTVALQRLRLTLYGARW